MFGSEEKEQSFELKQSREIVKQKLKEKIYQETRNRFLKNKEIDPRDIETEFFENKFSFSEAYSDLKYLEEATTPEDIELEYDWLKKLMENPIIQQEILPWLYEKGVYLAKENSDDFSKIELEEESVEAINRKDREFLESVSDKEREEKLKLWSDWVPYTTADLFDFMQNKSVYFNPEKEGFDLIKKERLLVKHPIEVQIGGEQKEMIKADLWELLFRKLATVGFRHLLTKDGAEFRKRILEEKE